MKNTNKGITLIALVITIIVMLILVAVTISMAVNGGLFEYAQRAGTKTNEAVENEQLLASGQVNIDNVVYNSIDEYINSGTAIDWDKIVEELPSKYAEYLTLAQAKGQDINAEKNVGIGTDGEVVNLGLWNYSEVREYGVMQGFSLGYEDSWGYELGYKGNIVDGKIQGKIPQYIYVQSANKVYPVIRMDCTFYMMSNLNDNLKIPTTVTAIGSAFGGCTSMTNIEIPSSVTYISTWAFTNVPHITYNGTAEGSPWGALSVN